MTAKISHILNVFYFMTFDIIYAFHVRHFLLLFPCYKACGLNNQAHSNKPWAHEQEVAT